MTELKKHHLNNTVFLRRIKRSENDFAVAFTRIFNIETYIKTFNITSTHLKSSHLKNEETHLITVYYLSKLDFYPYFDIARQKKENVIVIFTRNFSFVSHKESSLLFFQIRFYNIEISEISSAVVNIDLLTESSIYFIINYDILQRTPRYLYILFYFIILCFIHITT